jgi:hypothetical protein
MGHILPITFAVIHLKIAMTDHCKYEFNDLGLTMVPAERQDMGSCELFR